MNRLPAVISAVDAHGSIAVVEAAVGDYRFTATMIGAGDEVAAWKPGMAVALLFKETEVSLAKNLSGLISMRNRIPCVVTGIERGKLLSKVALNFHGHAIESVITTRSSHALSLTVGDEVEGLVKANEMTLVPETAQ
ncbi:MAG TPA: TOBE domain-containing protein [Noviherbaspirillum sp.]|uniref:TOBE domain-containing protein n=1 Tax=Noviherbaspirillum sp. TaxID=1926288 RepID=UPI002B4A566E|nr:TOBE domain-containing protein [Noviherbaspirillum sp.]HJV84349.1 TOBE domain-containing protein [Noviherbaspirillum sp.]